MSAAMKSVIAISASVMTEDENHNSIIREAVMYYLYGLRSRDSKVRAAACAAVMERVLVTMDAEHEEKVQYLNAVIVSCCMSSWR